MSWNPVVFSKRKKIIKKKKSVNVLSPEKFINNLAELSI